MTAITYENVESFYGMDFYGKSSRDTIQIIGKAKTNDGEEVILLDNRRFVTIKGFNMQYMPKADTNTVHAIYLAVKDKYMAEIRKAGEIVDGEDLFHGIYAKINRKYFHFHTHESAASFEVEITPYNYSRKVVRSYETGVLRHLERDYGIAKRKTLHMKNFEKVIGAYKDEKDFADKFFKKFGFLGLI